MINQVRKRVKPESVFIRLGVKRQDVALFNRPVRQPEPPVTDPPSGEEDTADLVS